MTQNATQAKKSRSFAEQSVFASSISSSMGILGLDKVALKTEIWASFKQEVNDMYILFFTEELAF